MDPTSLYPELTFNFTRSSGSGGQHVNKVETRVELRFDIARSGLLDEPTQQQLQKALRSRLNKDGVLLLSCEATRSQAQNRRKVLHQFNQLITQALRPRKKRKGHRRLTANPKERLTAKRRRSEKKKWRGKVNWPND